MKTKHTPGPWKVGVQFDTPVIAESGSHPDCAVVSDVAYFIDIPTNHATETLEPFANARLIEAAPELLDALEEIRSVLANDVLLKSKSMNTRLRIDDFIREYIDPIIAKATGGA